MAFEGTGCGAVRRDGVGARIRLWSLIALLGWAAAPAWSQDQATETARLEQLQKQISEREQRHSQLETQLAALQQSLRDAQSRPSPEQAELDEARQQLEQARTAQAAAPSETNASRLQNAEFKFALSERRFAKANSEAAALQSDIEQMQAEIDRNRAEIDRTAQQVTTQQATLARLQQQRQAEARQAQEQRLQRQRQEQQQQLEQQRAETAAAQEEIRRLRALLETRQAEQAQSETVVEPEPAAEAVMTSSTDDTANPVLLQDRTAVLATLTAIQQSLADADPRRVAVNRILHIKRGDSSNPFTLRAVTPDQYRAEARLAAGSTEFVVGFHRWQVDVPAGGDYIVLYNAQDSGQPHLQLYNRQLEN